MNVSPSLKFLLPAILLFATNVLVAQTVGNYSLVDNLNPVTPTMRQFTKYTDLPVSEYTGIPNISVPLYEIDEDGVKLPLDLTYNAGGIRVNDEASWVGLGWDMTVGSIVQQINDIDDWTATYHLKSDYVNSGTPQLFPYKYNYCSVSGEDGPCQYGCSGLLPVSPVIAADGIEVYTDQWAPFGGNYNLKDYLNYFDDHNYYHVDSEPDIYTANFLGHSFKFIMNWTSATSYQFVVLDKKGYSISRTGDIWKVLAPTGEEYDFAAKNPVTSQTASQNFGSGSASNIEPSANVWMLTQIITKNKKVITLNYNQTSVQPCLPTFTQRGIASTLAATFSGNTDDIIGFCRPTDNTGNFPSSLPTSYNLSSQTYSWEPYIYLSSITFPSGTINFSLSPRTDISGALKLDGIEVSTIQQVKSWLFNYSYYDATNVGGNTFTFNNQPASSLLLHRLQLLSVQDNSGATYTFTYNSTTLPAKNSFAVDYWGFYNGDISNTSVVPNATQFNQTGWVTNNDNHSANLTYAQAGLLTQIKYPTGGSVNFAYALNQFTNYWVPDYAGNTNTISSGNGLRVQSVTWNDASGGQLKKTNYTYNGGIASIPINFFRSYAYGTVSPGGLPQYGSPNWRSFTFNETNMSGCYSANPFASFNGVGYSQVIKTDVDNSGNPNGKTVSNYYNQPDLVYNSITVAQQTDPTLPGYKNPLDTADNGELKSELVYNSSNNLLKKVVNTYTNISSSIYYGARIMGYGSLVNYGVNSDGSFNQFAYTMSMVCYYPIYDFESLLINTAQTEYFGADSLTNNIAYTYDSYNQISSTIKSNSTYNETTAFTYPYGYPHSTVLAAMTTANRLSDIVTVSKSQPQGSVSLHRGYQQLGSLFVANADTSYTGLSYNPEYTTYDQYDPSNGNILQYTKNTVPNSFIWDYNKEYVIAGAKNALITDIAYTSFEADGAGGWQFTGTAVPDPAAPTGQSVYSLANGNISRTGLNTAKTYVVSYWSKNGAQTVSGGSAAKQGYTFNGYTYFEHSVANPASGTITVSGTGTIDELRLYPNTAQMTTYTYAPMVGITSESNAGGKIVYYEYDNAMRLLDIRDQNKNILKGFCYNYAGQPTTCGVNTTYLSAALAPIFTKTCSGAYVGTNVVYNVPLGKYTSTMSPDDANNQAAADVTAYGQDYANTNGSCVIPPTITNVQYGGHGTGYTEVIFTTIPNCSTATITYVDLTTNQPGGNTGACSSPQFVTVPIVGHVYRFTVTCYSPDFPSGITSAPFNYTAND